jgi:hypothetical protein
MSSLGVSGLSRQRRQSTRDLERSRAYRPTVGNDPPRREGEPDVVFNTGQPVRSPEACCVCRRRVVPFGSHVIDPVPSVRASVHARCDPTYFRTRIVRSDV